MTTHTITVTFDVESESPTHAVFLVNKFLADKGVHEKGVTELTPGSDGEMRTMPRFGYTTTSFDVVQKAIREERANLVEWMTNAKGVYSAHDVRMSFISYINALNDREDSTK